MLVTRTPFNVTFKTTLPKTGNHNIKTIIFYLVINRFNVMKRLETMLINTQCVVFKNPKFTILPPINTITFNTIDTTIKRTHSGALENWINVQSAP